MLTAHNYPVCQFESLTLSQLETVATTPLELALIARIEELMGEVARALNISATRLETHGIDDCVTEHAGNAIEKFKTDNKHDDLQSFYEAVTSEVSWLGAEPGDQNLQQAIAADIQLGQACREFTDYLVEEHIMAEDGAPYDEDEIAVALVNHWPQLRD